MLKPAFQNIPFWVLVLMVIVIGFPIHIIIGIFAGLCEGIQCWKNEISELLYRE